MAVRYHPEVLEALSEESVHHEAYKKYARKMLGAVADQIMEYADKFNDDRAWNRNNNIRKSKHDDHKSPALIADSVRQARRDAEVLIQGEVTERLLDNFIDRNSGLVTGLFPFGYSKQDVTKRLKDLVVRLTSVLRMDLFKQDVIDDADKRYMEAQQRRQAVEERVKQELMAAPRLKMSTIGSSHKLFDGTDDEKEDGFVAAMGKLAIAEDREQEGAIIVFDESGCIPSFELLGLSRLGCPIAALLTVGDKKQLPPYNPTNQSKRRGQRGRGVLDDDTGLKSLLDVSQIAEKIALRTQYRVPRDIANILDIRVYGGSYKTHARCGVAEKGLEFRHVEKSGRLERREYQNSDEVDMVFQLAQQAIRGGELKTIM